MIWEETRIDRLKKFWKEGKSAAAIAAEFGITKNAVIGKLNRLGLSFKKGKTPEIEGEAVPPAAVVTVTTPASGTPTKKETILEVQTTTNPTGRKVVALFDLKLSSCRWPIGDPRDESFGFCGKRKEIAAQPYCPACSQLAYAQSAKTMRKAS